MSNYARKQRRKLNNAHLMMLSTPHSGATFVAIPNLLLMAPLEILIK